MLGSFRIAESRGKWERDEALLAWVSEGPEEADAEANEMRVSEVLL